MKSSIVEIIYSEAQRTGKPVFCIVDDTIASKTKPSSQALHPIEDAYFLCDCWYVSEKMINTFVQKGFHTIGALKTNRLLYPSGMKKKLSELAAGLSVTEKVFDLVTVKKRKYYVYRYEGNLNGIENAVVLLSYPEKAFGNPKAPEGLAKFRRKQIMNSCTGKVVDWILNVSKGEIDYGKKSFAVFYVRSRNHKFRMR